jgi:hypothetical protein
LAHEYEHANEYPAFAQVNEFCRISGIRRSKVYMLLSDGSLNARKIGKTMLIDVHAGLDFINGSPSADIRMGRYSS